MKKFMSLFLAGVLSVGLVGCGGGKEKPEDAQKPDNPPVQEEGEKKVGGTLIAGVTEMSGNFNPAYYQSAYDGHVVDMVFQKLVDINAKGECEAQACKDWEVTNDGKDIIFHMKDDMTFSDGEKVTADDVVFTYKMLADPSYTGRYGSAVKDMVGYEEFSTGKTEEFKGVVKEDDYTVKFCFKEALRTNLEQGTQPILPEHYYGKNYKVGDTSSIEAITTEPMGSGPYVLEKFSEGEFASLKRRDDYKGEGYLIEKVMCKFVDNTTDIVELTSKEVDLLPGVVEPKKIDQARQKDFLTENHYDRSGYGYCKFNCEGGATADKKVRQALYYAFDIQQFVDTYYADEATGKPLASVQYHPFSQVSWAIDDALLSQMTAYKYDIEKSKSILDEAGWKVGASGYREKDGKVLEIKVAAMPDHDILATLIPMWQKSWGEDLKCKVEVAYLEFNPMMDLVQSNADANLDQWSIYFMANTFGTADPHGIYSDFHSDYIGSGKDNTCRYKNEEVDKLLDQGKSILDKEEAKPIYQKIAKQLNDDAPMMPVYANTYYDLYNKKIKNLNTSPFCNWAKVLKDAYIEE